MHGKREETHSVHYLGVQKLIQMYRNGFDTSKHDDKIENKKLTGRPEPAKDKIYIDETFRTYLLRWDDFCRSMKAAGYKVNGHNPRTLEEAKGYLPDYLEELKNRPGQRPGTTFSASSIRQYFSAVAKILGASALDEDQNGSKLYVLPARNRKDVFRSRYDAKRDKNLSLAKNEELIAFCRSTGLRNYKELRKIRGNCLVSLPDGSYKIRVVGKGKRVRELEIAGTPEQIRRVVDRIQRAGDNLVWQNVPDALDVHNLRAEYAAALYKKYARPLNEIPKEDRYYCRKDLKGLVLDKKAMEIVSNNLGHSRIDVFAQSYAYRLEV